MGHGELGIGNWEWGMGNGEWGKNFLSLSPRQLNRFLLPITDRR